MREREVCRDSHRSGADVELILLTTTNPVARARLVGLARGRCVVYRFGDGEHLLPCELHCVLAEGVLGAGRDDVVFAPTTAPAALTLHEPFQPDHLLSKK